MITDSQVSCLSTNGTYSTNLNGVEYGGSGYKLAVIKTSATTASPGTAVEPMWSSLKASEPSASSMRRR